MSLFDISKLEDELKELEKQTTEADFWSDSKKSSVVLGKIKSIKSRCENYRKIEKELRNLIEISELLKIELDDEMAKEVTKNTKNLVKEIEKLEIATLFSGKYDNMNAIVTIHPGAGGTESQDWAEMLYRMYNRWAMQNDFSIKELDYLEGEEAGLKSVTFEVLGENAYGYMKCEKGVHRLVRISPFDSGGRRHTSFASVEVLPEITDDIEIEINPDDLRVDTYRASGAGGQHINKTSSAVRLIHEPTGIVVECQTERSQLQNREYAMKMLRSKIYNIEKEKQDSEIANARKTQVGSGDRSEKIRTYNYPQGRITDHRIGMSIFQMENFLNGDLDEMIDNLSAADRAERLKGE